MKGGRVMNDNFKQKVKKTGKSIYKISQESGIPYTTLSELMNGKKNINHTSAETVYKLCLYLNCNINDILNNVGLLENGKGVYLGYHYQWKKKDNGIELHITDNNRDLVLLTLKTMCQDLYSCYMKQVPEMMIENYDEEKREWEGLL